MGWFGSNDTGSSSTKATNVEISRDTFLEHLNDLQGTKKFRLLEGLTAVVEGPITGLQQLFTEGKVTKNIDGFVMDGITTQRLIELASQTNIGVIVTEKEGPLSGLPAYHLDDLDLLTRASLNSPEFRDAAQRERAKRKQKERKRKEKKQRKGSVARALDKEEHLDYDGAIADYEEIGDKKSAKRVRKLKAEQGAVKVDQTVIHGDYVDDRDTIIKDSVLSKSNIGAGGKSKSEELRDAKALLDDGIIDDAEFKQMKKEILGK